MSRRRSTVLVAYDFAGEEGHVEAPNFYRVAAEKVFPPLGLDAEFLPVIRRLRPYLVLRRIGFGHAVASRVAITAWIWAHHRRYDVIMGWLGNGMTVALLRLMVRWRRPRLCLILYRVPTGTGPRRRLARILYRLASDRSELLVALDRSQAEHFALALGRRSGTHAIRYGVDSAWYEGHAGRTPGEASGRPVIFFPGSAARDDATVREAIRELDVDVVRLALGSPGEQPSQWNTEQVGRARVRSRTASPYAEYVRMCLDSTLVLIAVLSDDKPVGLTALLECMALGKATIITRGLSSSDYVAEGITGLTYEQGNARDLRRQVARCLGDQDLRERLGKAARQATRTYLGVQECGTALCNLLIPPDSGQSVAVAGGSKRGSPLHQPG